MELLDLGHRPTGIAEYALGIAQARGHLHARAERRRHVTCQDLAAHQRQVGDLRAGGIRPGDLHGIGHGLDR